jgi:hypothetical protein
MRAAGPGAREALAIGRTLSLDEGRDEALELAGVGANLLHAIP